MATEVTGKDIAWYSKWLLLVGCTLLFFKGWLYVRPFFPPVFLAGLLAVFLSGAHSNFVAFLKGRVTLAATIMTIGVMCIIVGPLSISSFYAMDKVADFTEVAMDETKRKEWQEKTVQSMENFAQDHPKTRIVMDKVIKVANTDQSKLIGFLGFKDAIKTVGGKVVSVVTSVLSNTLNIFGQMLVMLVALFMFLCNGQNMIQTVIQYVPIAKEDKERVLSETARGVNALFNSMIVTGAVQGGMATLAIGVYSFMYYPINILGFIFAGFMLAFFSAFSLPFASVAVAIYAVIAFAQHNIIASFVLAAVAGLIGVSDNYIKPKIMGKTVEVNPFILLAFMIGGVMVEGAIGLFSGPFLVILTINVGTVLMTEYKKYKQTIS
ncbi:MAG: AI-2E family transporter, partial [Patescibacteria group bacterium]